jgi:hypothetical protein
MTSIRILIEEEIKKLKEYRGAKTSVTPVSSTQTPA